MAGSVIVNDKVWKKIRKIMLRAAAEKRFVKVGVLASKDGDAQVAPGFTMVDLATTHEFGSPSAGIPERSFIRATFADTTALEKVTKPLAKALVTGKLSMRDALDKLGLWGATAVKKFITAGDPIAPPLKAATITAKGSDRPLVDTGRLVGSIQWEIES